jgi:predicted homoserine dehydrogenase-like protein
MLTLRQRLQEREKNKGTIRVGLVGTGQMGTGMMSQMEKMDGMKVVAAADISAERAAAAFGEAGVDGAQVVTENEDMAHVRTALAEGRKIATNSADFLVQIPDLDVIVEATGVPNVGAEVCYAAIMAGKAVVNMNVETDATIGYFLGKLAEERGVIYSLSAGDEPGAIKEMFDFADALGFEIVTIGKGKNNPLDRTANPDTVGAKAAAQHMSPKMLASFVDGTKTMVEMTAIGNATGYAPEVRGAYGPKSSVKELAKIFVPKSAGGIFNASGAVDYAVGDVAPGVFVIITTDQPKIITDLNYLRLNGGDGYWALYRPYHLANLETPISVAHVALDGHSTLVTLRPPVCETIAVAKRDLKAGESVDALGGFTVYGMIDRAHTARADNLLPLGLAVGAKIIRDVPQGEPLRYTDVELDESKMIVKLRRQQDAMTGKG